MRVKAAQTLRRRSIDFCTSYGESWTREECDIADLIDLAYKAKITLVSEIISFIQKQKNICLSTNLVQQVVDKINKTDEVLLKEEPIYLSDYDYNRLIQLQKPRKW